VLEELFEGDQRRQRARKSELRQATIPLAFCSSEFVASSRARSLFFSDLAFPPNAPLCAASRHPDDSCQHGRPWARLTSLTHARTAAKIVGSLRQELRRHDWIKPRKNSGQKIVPHRSSNAQAMLRARLRDIWEWRRGRQADRLEAYGCRPQTIRIAARYPCASDAPGLWVARFCVWGARVTISAMCGSFTQNLSWAEIPRLADLTGQPRNLAPRFNSAPTTP
jgi:hypothetical protein